MLGKLTKQDIEELHDDIDHEFLNNLLTENDIVERYESFAKADEEKALRKALDIAYPSHKSYSWKIAAVIICIIATGAFFWYQEYSHITPPEIEHNTKIAMVKALNEQRISGTEVTSSSCESTAYTQEIDDDYISTFHLSADMAEDMLHAENITTYRDKEHWLRLDDGTIVHLDGNTRIIYPEHFSRFGNREVVLDGDAYFFVAHDRSRRFIVHTKYGSVMDYGTEFFIANKKGFEVALISGSVGVKPINNSETLLSPGQKATLGSNGEISMTSIDIEDYKAFNTGKFVFAGKDLQSVMAILSRWYGINVYYDKEEYRHILITGNYDRCPEVAPLLESLEYVTGLRFVMNGNTVEVK